MLFRSVVFSFLTIFSTCAFASAINCSSFLQTGAEPVIHELEITAQENSLIIFNKTLKKEVIKLEWENTTVFDEDGEEYPSVNLTEAKLGYITPYRIPNEELPEEILVSGDLGVKAIEAKREDKDFVEKYGYGNGVSATANHKSIMLPMTSTGEFYLDFIGKVHFLALDHKTFQVKFGIQFEMKSELRELPIQIYRILDDYLSSLEYPPATPEDLAKQNRVAHFSALGGQRVSFKLKRDQKWKASKPISSLGPEVLEQREGVLEEMTGDYIILRTSDMISEKIKIPQDPEIEIEVKALENQQNKDSIEPFIIGERGYLSERQDYTWGVGSQGNRAEAETDMRRILELSEGKNVAIKLSHLSGELIDKGPGEGTDASQVKEKTVFDLYGKISKDYLHSQIVIKIEDPEGRVYLFHYREVPFTRLDRGEDEYILYVSIPE